MLETALSRLEPSRSDWLWFIKQEMKLPYMQTLDYYLKGQEVLGNAVYPYRYDIFKAFALSGFNETRVVIVGQSPYHTPHTADGLAFSAPHIYDTPASLKNIHRELRVNYHLPKNEILTNSLYTWAIQGVLLLNRVLTTEKDLKNGHVGKGWEKFTDRVIQELGADLKPRVFILWGNKAQELEKHIDDQHLILKSPHPSPLSASKGFFFQNHFLKANDFLREDGQHTIDWLSIKESRRFAK